MKSIDTDRTVIRPPREKREVWEQFRKDKELLDRLSVTHDELDALDHCALLGTLATKEDLLFILRQIREPRTSTDEEEAQSATGSRYEIPIEEPADPMPVIAARANFSAATNLRDPASFATISRNRRLEHLGIFAGALSIVAIAMWNLLGGISAWRDHFMASVAGSQDHAAIAQAGTKAVGSVSTLVVVEILVVGAIALVIYLRTHKSHRRFKVKPI